MSMHPELTARRTPGAGQKDFEPEIDMARMRRYRLGRVQAELRRRDIGAALLYDMANIRYATGTRNMAVFTAHYPTRYAMVFAEGPVILFDRETGPLKRWLPEVLTEVRPSQNFYYETNGDKVARAAQPWAEEIDALLRQHCGDNRRLAIDRLGAMGFLPLHQRGIEICDGQAVLEAARVIKNEDEIACMSISVSVCEAGIAAMQAALRPGISEQSLWAILADVNHQHGGEWMETRLLTSGGRTNPWYQECGEKLIRVGDLVAFDTDVIGPFGYCTDISRTFFCGPGRPRAYQKELYTIAREEIEHNIAQLRPGISFKELSDSLYRVPERFLPQRYSCAMHGVGLIDEYPDIVHPLDWNELTAEGFIQAGMVLCVESYVGEPGGPEGVKLEEEVLVTEHGVQRLSVYPFEEELTL